MSLYNNFLLVAFIAGGKSPYRTFATSSEEALPFPSRGQSRGRYPGIGAGTDFAPLVSPNVSRARLAVELVLAVSYLHEIIMAIRLDMVLSMVNGRMGSLNGGNGPNIHEGH